MDDTGASFPTIFEVDDIPSLCIPLGYQGWGAWEDVATANGLVRRQRLWLEAAVCDLVRNPVTSLKAFQFYISPGASYNGARLGGPVLWSLIFQGTAPDEQANMFIAANKTRLTALLPTV
ncbi:hypothetical protein BDZ91DRAFT_745984 [Kalaharituber pfeilii]|nr:hypothetical protein BDZ91DRAFT_745984 [Kalaharituber pfeilii]